jgi:hypothetical protein
MLHHHSHVLYVCVRRLRDVPFRQYVGFWTRCCILVCLGTASTRGFFVCVGVWVNRNGRPLGSVKISGSHSGDCDDCCCQAVTRCNLLDRYFCFGGTLLWYMKKGQWCWEGGKGFDYKWISGRILFLCPEDWGSRFLQNVATCLLNYTAFLPEEGSTQN